MKELRDVKLELINLLLQSNFWK